MESSSIYRPNDVTEEQNELSVLSGRCFPAFREASASGALQQIMACTEGSVYWLRAPADAHEPCRQSIPAYLVSVCVDWPAEEVRVTDFLRQLEPAGPSLDSGSIYMTPHPGPRLLKLNI